RAASDAQIAETACSAERDGHVLGLVRPLQIARDANFGRIHANHFDVTGSELEPEISTRLEICFDRTIARALHVGRGEKRLNETAKADCGNESTHSPIG